MIDKEHQIGVFTQVPTVSYHKLTGSKKELRMLSIRRVLTATFLAVMLVMSASIFSDSPKASAAVCTIASHEFAGQSGTWPNPQFFTYRVSVPFCGDGSSTWLNGTPTALSTWTAWYVSYDGSDAISTQYFPSSGSTEVFSVGYYSVSPSGGGPFQESVAIRINVYPDGTYNGYGFTPNY